MCLRAFFVLFCLWLPVTTGQGCPYSRTAVPGDPKRYIEVVHNIPHERHCAPGTEFDQLSCECSLLSAIPWSAGDPTVSLLGLDSRPSQSKTRKSNQAESQYDPLLPGHGLQNHELLRLLSYQKALELYSTKGNKNEIVKTSSAKGLHASSLPQIPQLDLFARTDTRKSKGLGSSLTSPLLNQDLATITAFLKQRRAHRRLHALQSLAPKLTSTSFVTGRLPIQSQSFPKIQREITHASFPEQNVLAAITKNIKSQTTKSAQTENNVNSRKTGSIDIVNSPTTGSVQTATNLDAQKSAILQKLMSKLTALQAQTSNSGHTSTGQRQFLNTDRQPIISGHSQTARFSSLMAGLNPRTNPGGFARTSKSSRSQTSRNGQQSPYSMMFRSVAAKEGVSDAQEIMQDRITESGGAAFAMGSPLIGVNSEIRSQLSSTFLENHPLSFLL